MENNIPKKNSVERTITSEHIEKVMERVVDIDAKNTMFTRVGSIHHSSVETAWASVEYNMKRNAVIELLAKKVHEGEISEIEYSILLEQESRKLDEEVKEKAEVEWGELKKLIQDILSSGVVGRSKLYSQGKRMSKEDSVDVYTDSIKRNGINSPVVYTNIIGRSDHAHFEDNIRNSHWNQGDFTVNIIIDRDSYKEVDPDYTPKDLDIFSDKWTYRADDPQVASDFKKAKKLYPDIQLGDSRLANYGYNDLGHSGFDENGMPRPLQEYGFVIFPRVPVRFIKGIVIKMTNNDDVSRAEEIINLVKEASSTNSHMFIPVYDAQGNLLWPKKMTHEEIVKMKEISEETK